MSFYFPHPLGLGAMIVRAGKQMAKDAGGFAQQSSKPEPCEQPLWWKTDLLPEPLRHESGHGG